MASSYKPQLQSIYHHVKIEHWKEHHKKGKVTVAEYSFFSIHGMFKCRCSLVRVNKIDLPLMCAMRLTAILKCYLFRASLAYEVAENYVH